jgi:hypothetical protein
MNELKGDYIAGSWKAVKKADESYEKTSPL